ncbi:MAG: ROK family protein [Bacterioplanes sp.]|nr:ROK family protein [Bacterioplanes sp.]
MLQFGIDLGGTKTEIIALDAEGNTHLRQRIATPSHDYYAIIDAISGLIQQAKSDCHTTDFSLGIGIPGAISPATGLIKNANTTCLIGKPFQHDLQHALQHEVTLANDADCFALSEATDGAAAGYASVFGVILGTGCGGGIVIHGQLLNGPNAIAGEWGHNPLPWLSEQDHANPCYCGQHGCIETFLSGPGLQRHAMTLTGIELSVPQWQQRALTQDRHALAVFDYYNHCLARALASVINVLDPAAIVLGGGLSNLPDLYHEVPRRWQSWAFSDSINTPLLPAHHGDSSGVRGAAWLGAQAARQVRNYA